MKIYEQTGQYSAVRQLLKSIKENNNNNNNNNNKWNFFSPC